MNRPGNSVLGLSFVAVLAAIFIFLQHRSPNALAQSTNIEINSESISHFQIDKPARTQFDSLHYSSGIVFWSDNEALGGISGIRVMDGGQTFLSVTDKGNWLTGTIERDVGGRITGINSAKIAPLRNKKGKPITTKKSGDAEGLEIFGDHALVSFERKSRILDYKIDLNNFATPGKIFRGSIRKVKLPNNSGLEAITVLEPETDVNLRDVNVVVFSENSLDGNGNIRGFISKKKKWKEFTVLQKDGYKITDSTLLPDGDIVLLERQFSLITGVRIRIRKFSVGDIVPGALIDGETLLEVDSRFQVDNLEGISAWVNAENQTMLTLVSDNNFSPLQRNILLEFRLEKKKD